MRYSLKSMTVSEVLDVSVNLVRDHFKPLFRIALYLIAPPLILLQLANVYLLPPPPGIFASMAEREAYNVAIQGQLLPMMVINLGFWGVYGLFLQPLANAAISRAVASTYLGKPFLPGAAVRESLALVLPLVVVNIMYFLIYGVGFLLFVIPGIYFMVRFYLATFAVVIEGAGPITALERSWALMNGNWTQGFVLGLVLFLAMIGSGMSVAFIPERHIQGVTGALVQACMQVVMSAAGVVFYFSCRCKQENFDLTVLASAVGQDAPATEAAPPEPVASNNLPQRPA